MRGQTTLSPNFSEVTKPTETKFQILTAPNAERNGGHRGQTTLSPNFSEISKPTETKRLIPVAATLQTSIPNSLELASTPIRGAEGENPVKPVENSKLPLQPEQTEYRGNNSNPSPPLREGLFPNISEDSKPGETIRLAPGGEKNRGKSSLSPVSPPLSPIFRTENVVEDPTILINVVRLVTTAPLHNPATPEVQPSPTHLVSIPMESEEQPPQRLNLAEFGVTRFVYKTEVIKPVKPVAEGSTFLNDLTTLTPPSDRPAALARPTEVQSVRLVFEPPPPPLVVRSVSMDIGDPESQVRVIIRERNGNLNVQIGSANERLREDLQIASPMLMRELQRNNPMPVTLDFSNFGSATDADGQPRSQSRAKKFLKSDAEFADVVETTYLPGPSATPKSL